MINENNAQNLRESILESWYTEPDNKSDFDINLYYLQQSINTQITNEINEFMKFNDTIEPNYD